MPRRKQTEGEKKIDISQMAEDLGVSKTTVSRALSGNGRVSEATRARVVQYGCGLGGAKIDKALVAGALNHALGSLAGGGVNIRGHDARLALAGCGLAFTSLGKKLLPQSGVVQLPTLKAPALAGGARSAIGQDIHGLQQQAAAGARGIDQRGQGLVLVIVGRQLALAQLGPANLRQHQGSVVGAQHVRSLAGARRGGRQALEQRIARKVQADARTALTK